LKKGAERLHLNDDKSPLIDLLSCFVCKETMKIEKSAPDAEGSDIIQYRCCKSWKKWGLSYRRPLTSCHRDKTVTTPFVRSGDFARG
jgi:hypothetical protein